MLENRHPKLGRPAKGPSLTMCGMKRSCATAPTASIGGAADKDWRLVPSLNRVCTHDLGLEQAIIRSFRKYGYTDLAQYTGFWQLLPVAQHYGLPTRLLDWSYSPLVAAHFATEDTDAYDRDGRHLVYRRHRGQAPPSQAPAQAFGGSQLQYLLPRPSRRGSARFRRDAGRSPRSPTPSFLSPPPCSTASPISTRSFPWSATRACCSPTYSNSRRSTTTRSSFPREVKLEIRDKLDYINISERMLYPGLDGICRWIARQYSALGPKYNRRRDGSRPNA